MIRCFISFSSLHESPPEHSQRIYPRPRPTRVCRAERAYGARVNANVAPFDAAVPGALPAVNARAVELAARLGFALGGVARQILLLRIARHVIDTHFEPSLLECNGIL